MQGQLRLGLDELLSTAVSIRVLIVERSEWRSTDIRLRTLGLAEFSNIRCCLNGLGMGINPLLVKSCVRSTSSASPARTPHGRTCTTWCASTLVHGAHSLRDAELQQQQQRTPWKLLAAPTIHVCLYKLTATHITQYPVRYDFSVQSTRIYYTNIADLLCVVLQVTNCCCCVVPVRSKAVGSQSVKRTQTRESRYMLVSSLPGPVELNKKKHQQCSSSTASQQLR